MIIEPYNKASLPKRIDVNKKFKDTLKGELDEDIAKKTLAEFLYYNIQFTTHILTGLYLAPFQAAIIRGWFEKNYSLAVWGRGCGKSSLVGIFCVLYAIFNPGTRILIVSSNFRSSRRILETLEVIASKQASDMGLGGTLLKQAFKGDLSKRNDIFQLQFHNQSAIVCLPLANGEGLRGQRANVLIVDEALLVSRSIIENVLIPFLAAKGTDVTTEILRIREMENEQIRAGIITEAQRKKFKSKNKMIFLSSASFQGEYFHEIYLTYLKKIEGIKDAKMRIDAAQGKLIDEDEEEDISHFVSQLSYEVLSELAPDILDKGILQEVQSGNIPQQVIDREYKAQFVQDSGGLFRMSRMKACTVPDGERPCVEIKGEPGFEYILGIDPNVSGSEIADHFAMTLLKIVTKKDGRKIPLLVHSYAATAVDLGDHLEYLAYLLKNFNIVYIAVDTTQGANLGFINQANESLVFANHKLRLLPIDAEFGRDDQTNLVTQIRESYDLKAKRIVQYQNFHSTFQSAAVDHLQACIDFGNIMFAGKAYAVPDLAAQMSAEDIGNIHMIHKQFNTAAEGGNPMFEFIERQDYLVDLTKAECAIVVVSVSNLGTRSFDIPNAFKKSKNINRPRKDNFSSLMLANWACKLYQEMMERPEEAPPEYQPVWIV